MKSIDWKLQIKYYQNTTIYWKIIIKNMGHFYRSKSERIQAKNKNVINKKTDWFNKIGYAAVLNVESTPNAQLATQMKKAIKHLPLPNNMKILVTEKMGTQIKNKIVNSINPWEMSTCKRKNCMLCGNNVEGSKGKCWQSGTTYAITCNLCDQNNSRGIYIGETGRPLYTRSVEHAENLKNKRKGKPLHEHMNAHHPTN